MARMIPPRTYFEWRARRTGTSVLRENTLPPERLLQAVWHHQRIRRDQLFLLDGRRLTVIHPGFWNREAGPDFRDALLQFGDEPPRTGDVEVDLQASGWRGHGHDRNAAYRDVILHVVWEDTKPVDLPTLVLKPLLDTPLAELETWHGSDAARQLPLELLGRCCGPLQSLTAEGRTDLLRQAALCRLQAKAEWFGARARQAGWEQALWEGTFRALGYKHNTWPMQRLAEVLPRLRSIELKHDGQLSWQAHLLGTAGLLPAELPTKSARTPEYLRQLWNLWWRQRDACADITLPRAAWRFAGLRPANRPERRLALAAHWLAEGKLMTRLEGWFAKATGQPKAVNDLLAAMQVKEDEFWSRHWTLNSAGLPQPQPLLGATRVTDLAINVILPWFWMRASTGRNEALRLKAETLYLQWPCAEDNAVLKLARSRLLGGAKAGALRTAAEQQGLLQIVRDFCEHSNAACTDCRFPELVKRITP